MNSNKVDTRVFATLLGFLFLAVGTVFASSNQNCRSELKSCCMRNHAPSVQCTGTAATSRLVPKPTGGSCCTTIAGAAENNPVAVIQQDNSRDSQAGSRSLVSAVLSTQLPRSRTPFRGRLDPYDSHLRTSVDKYLLTSTFLI